MIVYARNLLAAWISNTSELKVIFRWKKCQGSEMKSNRLGKRGRKAKSSARTDSHKSDKQQKPEKCQPLPRGPRYERYTFLTTNQATILEEAFNAKIPIQLPLIPPPRLGLDKTKHCKYHHNHGHNTKDYWSLKDKIKELIQARYLA